MSEEIFYNISLDNISSLFSSIDLTLFPPQSRSLKWTAPQKYIDLAYEDGSVLAAGDELFYLVSLPSLMQSHLQGRYDISSLTYSILTTLFVNKFYGNRGMISLHINGQTFSKGQKINIQLLPVKDLKLDEFYLNTISNKSDTLLTKCSEDMLNNIYNCGVVLKEIDYLKFVGVGFLSNGEIVQSNQEEIFVQDIDVEIKDLLQDNVALKDIAYKTGGIYLPIDSLDSMLDSIEINPLEIVEKHYVSGAKLYKYWWLLILLLTIEWFLRKRLGLL
jgi:hypothetical protein